jgi:hypothetical protein
VTERDKQRRTGPSRRTAAERAAIDKRAGAWPRPLSPTQRDALVRLARGCRGVGHGHGFYQTAAGWHARGDIRFFSTRTMDSLCKRGLAKRWRSAFVITTAGRRHARSVL